MFESRALVPSPPFLSVEDGEGRLVFKAQVKCLAKPHLTACICKAGQASSWPQSEPGGIEKETDNRKLQLNATVTFAEDTFIV